MTRSSTKAGAIEHANKGGPATPDGCRQIEDTREKQKAMRHIAMIPALSTSRSRLPFYAVCVICGLAWTSEASAEGGRFYVTNSATAIAIAESVHTAIFGKKTVAKQRPFSAMTTNGTWIVSGSRARSLSFAVPPVAISMSNGCVSILGSGSGMATNLVPDRATAVRIAEAILIPIYGESTIKGERPFNARLANDTWFVEGTMRDGPLGLFPNLGGVALVQLSRTNAMILRVTHGR